jgi:conjugal transfer/entry exclusion protein
MHAHDDHSASRYQGVKSTLRKAQRAALRVGVDLESQRDRLRKHVNLEDSLRLHFSQALFRRERVSSRMKDL